MVNIVEFPGIGLSFDVPSVAFSLFGMPIYWYGVCIATGMLLALVFVFAKAKKFGIDSDRMVDVILIGFFCAIVGGRAYYIIFDGIEKYDTLFKLLDLRSGGIAIYGAIVAAVLGAVLGCKLRKVPTFPMLDLAGMGLLIGQACGRWGNFFNQEAFGNNTNLPWGMISPQTTAFLQMQQEELARQGITVNPLMPVHPAFLYESLWCAIGLLLCVIYIKHRKFNGEIFLFYVAWYGVGRFMIEGLRTDSLLTLGGGMPVSQILAAVSALAAFCVWVFVKVRRKGAPLVVPALPAKEETVKLDTADGVKKVKISWAAEEKEPNISEKRKLALAKLEKEKP